MSLSMKVRTRVIEVLLTAALAASLPAFASETHDFNVPAEQAPDAVREFASQAHVQILVADENVKDKQLHAVSGTYSTDQGLHILLADSGLAPQYVGDRSIALVAASQVSAQTVDDQQKEGKKSSSDGFRVAQVDQASPAAVGTVGNSLQASQGPQVLQEVIVTAQKREQRIQDVPISMVVLSANELAKQNSASIDDLPTMVPGLIIQDTGQQRRIDLRGVSNIFGSGSLTSLYLDEAEVTSFGTFGGATQPELGTYDLQRVEVLRGPQGTLYGDNSVGGVVRFVTNNPKLDRFEFTADAAALWTQSGAPGERLQSAINIPLVADQLAIRVAGWFEHDGGWIDQPAANATNINYQDIADVRAKVMWQPVTDFSATLLTEVHRNNEVPSAFVETANGPAPSTGVQRSFTQEFNLTTTPRVEDNYNLYNATLTYDVGSIRLLNTTTYMWQSTVIYNAGRSLYWLGPPPSSPYYQVYIPSSPNDETNLNDEFRVTTTGTGAWQGTAGAYFRRSTFDDGYSPFYFAQVSSPGSTLPPPIPGNTAYGRSKSWAFFADTSYKFLDRITIGAGVRYYRDDEEATGSPGAVTQTATFDSVDPRFYVNIKLRDDLNVYANAAKGFRSGGFNNLNLPTFGPEDVWSYELGVKATALDHQLSMDADVFYSDYSQFVVAGVSTTGTPGNFYRNAGDAVIKGIEWNARWQLPGQWVLGVSGDYLDSYFKTIDLATSPPPAYRVGDNVDFVYKYQGNAFVERDFKWDGRAAFARLYYSLLGPSTYRNRSIGPWYLSESDVINMLNFDAGIQWNDALSLGVFVQNLTNDQGFTSPLVIENLAAQARPRTYGVKFGVKFD